MEENRYGINWLSLFLKVIIFVVVVLLAIWLITRITMRDKGLSIEENSKKFKDATVEYFRKNLPEDGKTQTVTLNQLISWDYLEELKNEDGKLCNTKISKSRIELVDGYYSIKSELVCGSQKETTYTKLGNETCVNCDVKIKGLEIKFNEESKDEEEQKEETTNNSTTTTENSKGSSTNNSSNNNSTNKNQSNTNGGSTSNQTILYEYVKETNEYSDWYVGTVTGEDIENSTRNVSYSKYCKNEEYTYYTVGYTTRKIYSSYELELINLNNASSVKLKNYSQYFTNITDYQNYLNNKGKDLKMVGDTSNGVSVLPTVSTIMNSALGKNNFYHAVTEVKEKNGKYYVTVMTNIQNLNGVTPYYASALNSNIYYVPVKFTVSYVNENNCISDKTENSSNYKDYTVTSIWNETIDIYRKKITELEYVYSNKSSLEGYKKTGNTKLAS